MGYQKLSPIEILGEFPSKPKVRVSSTGLTNNLIITRRRREETKKKRNKNEKRKGLSRLAVKVYNPSYSGS